MASEPLSISCLQLIDYCSAEAAGRARLMEQFREDSFEAYKNWYRPIPKALGAYLASGCVEPGALSDLEQELSTPDNSNTEQENRILKQLDAIDHIRACDLKDLLTYGDITTPMWPWQTMPIGGVRVRVNPSNLVSAPSVDGRLRVGAIKPYLRATEPLSERKAKLYGALLHWYAESHLSHLGEADRTLCWVIDVFAERRHQSPNAYKRLRQKLAANCSEIAERWSAHSGQGVAVPGSSTRKTA